MKRTGLAILLNVVMIAGLAPAPSWARVEGYGPRRVTQVGRGEWHGDRGHGVVIDRRRGPGWGGVAAAGILGAVAGLALGGAVAPPVVAGPPVIGTMIPYLPAGCVTVPTYTGAVLYNCGGYYYQPIYEGTSLMYQIVPAP
jgi:hypothetical protein